MARNYHEENIVGGNTGAWGTPELNQNRLALPINTIRFYNDSGTLKAYAGKCGLVDSSKYGICHNTAVYTISLVGVTNGNWFKVEIARSGTSFTMIASDTDTGSDTDPGVLPPSLLSNYDYEKGGFYIDSEKRTIALGYKDSGGVLKGIINIGSENMHNGTTYPTTGNSLIVNQILSGIDTGWLLNELGGVGVADWTNVHLGTDPTDPTDNLTHNLNAPLSDLIVKVLISTDGTDNNSFTVDAGRDTNTGVALSSGITISQVDSNNILIQTGDAGIVALTAAGGSYFINTQNWYYKIKIWKLG